jgi:hypothetical protein
VWDFGAASSKLSSGASAPQMCNERTGILLRAQNGRLPSRRRAVIDKDELQKMTEVPFPARTVPTGWPARFRPESAADKKICKVSP